MLPVQYSKRVAKVEAVGFSKRVIASIRTRRPSSFARTPGLVKERSAWMLLFCSYLHHLGYSESRNSRIIPEDTMSPFELMNTARWGEAPFAVECPHCGSSAAYQQSETKLYPTHASCVAVDAGGEPDGCGGTIFGKCSCSKPECQEHVHFIGEYWNERDDFSDPAGYAQKFIIKYFFPPVPLLKSPPATPSAVASLLKRSFAPAFMDQGASGHLLRSAIETLLTKRGVPRFGRSKKNERYYLPLHKRILRLPPQLLSHTDALLAVKWIGNSATHDELDVGGLKLAFEIVESLLENLYGTKKRDLSRAIRRVNRRKKP